MKVSNLHLVLTLSALTTLGVNSAANTDTQVAADETPYYSNFFTGLFTPEGQRMLEKMDKKPRRGRYLSMSLERDQNGILLNDLYDAINQVDISEDEDEEDDEYEEDSKTSRQEHESIIQVQSSYCSDYDESMNVCQDGHKLNEIRIKAAVYNLNYNRLKELLIKKKFRTLTSYDKLEIFHMAIAMFSRSTNDKEIYEILELLLDCGFATGFSAKEWGYDTVSRTNCSVLIETVLEDQRASEILIAHDNDFFRRFDDSHNYIIGLINHGKYDAAKRALEYGLDPSIRNYYNNRNSLDVVKSLLSSKVNWAGQQISAEDLEKLSDLVKILEKAIEEREAEKLENKMK